eukprot:jgi/Ulvmu1/599/UM001_0607.1
MESVTGSESSDPTDGLHADFINFAATLIQSAFRGYVQRKRYATLVRQSRALQSAWLSRDQGRIARELAATIVQRSWRAFAGKKMLAYYKSLIALHERTDPREVLKMVNPREANMMDAAAGLHIRFRLDGTVDPPRLMYKIFTHRPIADICAFCPRDYSGAALAATPTSHAGPHNVQHVVYDKSHSDASAGYPAGWYQRHENNSWRPVDTNAADHDRHDWSIKKKSRPVFHYSTKVRAAQRLRQQKLRRREWLMALYRQQTGQQPEAPTGDEDEEATGDDLMQWCDDLDFDKYVSDWRCMATTMASEAFLPVDELLPELPAWAALPVLLLPQQQELPA